MLHEGILTGFFYIRVGEHGFVTHALSQTSRGQRGKRERLGTRLSRDKEEELFRPPPVRSVRGWS